MRVVMGNKESTLPGLNYVKIHGLWYVKANILLWSIGYFNAVIVTVNKYQNVKTVNVDHLHIYQPLQPVFRYTQNYVLILEVMYCIT